MLRHSFEAAKPIWRLALHDYDKIIQLDPNDVLAYSDRARINWNLDQHQGSIQGWDRVIHLDPNLAMAYTNRGLTYYETGLYQRAIQDFNKASRLLPL